MDTTPGRRPPDYAGMAALFLALFLGAGWGFAIVMQATPWTDEITAEGAALLTGIGQVLAGALATFLGSRIHRDDVRDDVRDNDTDTLGE